MGEPNTFLDVLLAALGRAADFNTNDQTPPAAVLWPDKERQWEPLLPILRQHLPLLTLGDYAPAERTGPATYLRCMIARTLEDKLPAGAIPILYLPASAARSCAPWRNVPSLFNP